MGQPVRTRVEAVHGNGFMARGAVKKIGTWDRLVADLRARQSQFRMSVQSNSPWIQIREIKDGKRIRNFSSLCYAVASDAHIEQCYQACLKASAAGQWELGTPEERKWKQAAAQADRWGEAAAVASGGLTWAGLAAKVLADVEARIPRKGSREHAVRDLKSIANFSGVVCPETLMSWAQEKDPVTMPKAYQHRLDTLSHINRLGDLIDLDKIISRLRAARPTGSAKRLQEDNLRMPRAIPSDGALEAWLDQIKDPTIRWTLALISTYGIRTHEAWHVTGIDDRNWLTVPGDGLTKNVKSRFVPPVPSAWVERYGLKRDFTVQLEALNNRYKVQWEERPGGSRIPLNNPAVTHALGYYLTRLKDEDRLSAPLVDGSGVDWVNPYDLRHSYAIRCFTSNSVNQLDPKNFAMWMGHGLTVHERKYLKWMSTTREKARLQDDYDRMVNAQQPGWAKPETALPDEIQRKLAKLAQLEALLQA